MVSFVVNFVRGANWEKNNGFEKNDVEKIKPVSFENLVGIDLKFQNLMYEVRLLSFVSNGDIGHQLGDITVK